MNLDKLLRDDVVFIALTQDRFGNDQFSCRERMCLTELICFAGVWSDVRGTP
jgi:hypothetical protein